MPVCLYSPSSVGIVPVRPLLRKFSAHGICSNSPLISIQLVFSASSAQFHMPWQIRGCMPQMVLLALLDAAAVAKRRTHAPGTPLEHHNGCSSRTARVRQ